MNLPISFLENRGQTYGVEHVLAHRSGPLLDILQEKLQLTPEKSHFLLDFGAIYLNQERLQKKLNVAPPWVDHGAYLRVHQNPRRFPTNLFHFESTVIDENEDLLVVAKPAGLPVHPTVDNTQENLQNLLENKLGYPLFVTHRLDVPTEGLLVFAKNKTAQSEFNQLLMNGLVQKIYRAQALTTEKLPTEVFHYMKPSPRAPKEVSTTAFPGWAPCRLRIMDQEILDDKTSELMIELITGRTHQIRAQLSALGAPLVGDVAYGASKPLANYEKISLCACYLSFTWEGQEKRYRLQKVNSKY